MVGLEHPAAGPDRGRDRLRAALVARAAQQTHLKARRAERLARLRTCAAADGPVALLTPAPAADEATPSVVPACALAPNGEPGSAPAPSVAPAGEPTEAAVVPPVPAPDPVPAALPPGALRDAEALERLLAALIGTFEPEPDPAPAAPPAAVVPLPRPAREDASDAGELATLPGAGPGLVAALIRAGVPDLATLAALGPVALATRLGPLARLIDLDVWIAHARGRSGAA